MGGGGGIHPPPPLYVRGLSIIMDLFKVYARSATPDIDQLTRCIMIVVKYGPVISRVI